MRHSRPFASPREIDPSRSGRSKPVESSQRRRHGQARSRATMRASRPWRPRSPPTRTPPPRTPGAGRGFPGRGERLPPASRSRGSGSDEATASLDGDHGNAPAAREVGLPEGRAGEGTASREAHLIELQLLARRAEGQIEEIDHRRLHEHERQPDPAELVGIDDPVRPRAEHSRLGSLRARSATMKRLGFIERAVRTAYTLLASSLRQATSPRARSTPAVRRTPRRSRPIDARSSASRSRFTLSGCARRRRTIVRPGRAPRRPTAPSVPTRRRPRGPTYAPSSLTSARGQASRAARPRRPTGRPP